MKMYIFHASGSCLYFCLSVLRMEGSADKRKNGHLNPAFHLKVVGPVNKVNGHKGVSDMCVSSVLQIKQKKGKEEMGVG